MRIIFAALLCDFLIKTYAIDFNPSLLESKVIQRKSPATYILSFRKVDNSSDSGIHFCSGVLITEENVLSTGRCLKRASLIIYPLYDDVFVLTGEENTWSPRTKALIRLMVVHPNYSEGRNFDNDIAVVTLDRTLTLLDLVHPISLPSEAVYPEKLARIFGCRNQNETIQCEECLIKFVAEDNCHYNFPLNEGQLCGFTENQANIPHYGTSVRDEENHCIIALLSVIDYSNPDQIFRPIIFTYIWHYIPFINEAIQLGQDAPCREVTVQKICNGLNEQIVKYAE